MFERYTEKARRVIFFARYEASQFGAQAIEVEHILLGLLREDKQLSQRLFREPDSTVEAIRKEIEDRSSLRDKISVSVDLPLSQSAKRALMQAADESANLGDRHIGTEHLLLGILREDQSSAAKILYERGLRLDQMREKLTRKEERERGVVASNETYLYEEPTTEELLSQLSKLLDILAQRGIFSREEFKSMPDRPLPSLIQDSFNLLLNLLVNKGVISEEEKRNIASSGQ